MMDDGRVSAYRYRFIAYPGNTLTDIFHIFTRYSH